MAEEAPRFPAICSLCGQRFSFPPSYDFDHAVEWMAREHLPIHAVEMMVVPEIGALIATGGVMCFRCQRYASPPVVAPKDALHRKCFSADPACFCPCSSMKETDVAVR